MKLTLITLGAMAALASSPAMAQLAGSGNLVGTEGQQPNWPGVNHQSTTMVAGGGGTRGAITNVNGGDLAPSVNNSQLIVAPKQVRDNTPNRSAGAWVEAGQQSGGLGKGTTVRADLSNGAGAGPKDTYRSVDLNTPKGASGAVGNGALAGNLGGGKATNGAVTNVAGNLGK